MGRKLYTEDDHYSTKEDRAMIMKAKLMWLVGLPFGLIAIWIVLSVLSSMARGCSNWADGLGKSDSSSASQNGKKGPIKFTPIDGPYSKPKPAPAEKLNIAPKPKATITPLLYLRGSWKLEGAGLEMDLHMSRELGYLGHSKLVSYDTKTDTGFQLDISQVKMDQKGILVDASPGLNLGYSRIGPARSKNLPRGVFKPLRLLFIIQGDELQQVLMTNTLKLGHAWHRVKVIESPLKKEQLGMEGVVQSYKEYVTYQVSGSQRMLTGKWGELEEKPGYFILLQGAGFAVAVNPDELEQIELPHPDSEIDFVTNWGKKSVRGTGSERMIIATKPKKK